MPGIASGDLTHFQYKLNCSTDNLFGSLLFCLSLSYIMYYNVIVLSALKLLNADITTLMMMHTGDEPGNVWHGGN